MDKIVNRLVMAIGAHADDLEINIGGTLLKYRDLGYDILYIMATNNMSGITASAQPDGTIKRIREMPAAHMARRKQECAAAAAVLGTEPIHLDYPQYHYNTGQGDEVVEARYGSSLPQDISLSGPTILTACQDKFAIASLANTILEREPEIILTHGVAQRNVEHFAVCLLVTHAFWNAVERGYQGGLLQWREAITLHGDYHTRWETYVNCQGYLDRKMDLVGKHACQMPDTHKLDHGHRQLGEWRGKLCGCETAELFTWVRRPTRGTSRITGAYAPVHGELTAELIQNSR